jgi:hypothetical protein
MTRFSCEERTTGGIPFLLDERAHRMGMQTWLSIEYDKSPHVLWSGRTGSGKTVAAKLLLARSILLAPPELQPVELTVIDPKSDTDFDYLDGLTRFYRGDEAPQGFNNFFDAFIRRRDKQDLSANLKICYADEFASLINLIDDKKEKEAAQRKLALLLMLSRSRRFSVQLATQQPSAKMFGESGSASREQFGAVCLLGDSGAETQAMLFDGDSRERIKAFGVIGGRGVGWLSVNAGIAQPVRVPMVGAMEKLNRVIYDNLAR